MDHNVSVSQKRHRSSVLSLEYTQVVENDRRRMIAIERLILEMICFNFGTRMSFSYTIKVCRTLGCSKDLTKIAWHLAVDSHRTLIPLQYPPHTIALACVYLAALLTSFDTPATPRSDGDPYVASHEISAILGDHGSWEKKFNAHVEDLEDIVHALLDLLTSFAINAPSSLTTSPRTPSSPSAHHLSTFTSHISPNAPSSLAHVLSSTASLTRLKIMLRGIEHEPRERIPASMTDPTADMTSSGDDTEGIGKNEGTVRFLFGPPGT